VRAADGRAVIRHGHSTACRLAEVPSAERPEILRRYLRKVPGGRPHIPVRPHAPPADFEAIAARYPVFRVVPEEGHRTAGGPGRGRRWWRWLLAGVLLLAVLVTG